MLRRVSQPRPGGRTGKFGSYLVRGLISVTSTPSSVIVFNFLITPPTFPWEKFHNPLENNVHRRFRCNCWQNTTLQSGMFHQVMTFSEIWKMMSETTLTCRNALQILKWELNSQMTITGLEVWCLSNCAKQTCVDSSRLSNPCKVMFYWD